MTPPLRRRFPLLVVWVALASITLPACGDDQPGTESLLEALVERGVDVDALFAAPSMSELDDMRAAWRAVALEPNDMRELSSVELDGGDTLRVLSHLVGEQRHYGVVIIPGGEHEPGTLPVLLLLSGFGREMVLEIPPDARAYGEAFVTVFPSFRGHELRVAGESWMSDGDPFDQCDGGTDDALAFLEVALATTPAADAARVVVAGGSRGGNVAMLAGVRRTGVDGVVSIAGPTNYLQADLLEHPNLAPLYANYFVEGLLDAQGGPSTDALVEARRRMLACSPIHFAATIPPLQAHHGTADENVPFAQAEQLSKRMAELGREPPSFELFVYEGGDHQLVAETGEVSARLDAFVAAVSE